MAVDLTRARPFARRLLATEAVDEACASAYLKATPLDAEALDWVLGQLIFSQDVGRLLALIMAMMEQGAATPKAELALRVLNAANGAPDPVDPSSAGAATLVQLLAAEVPWHRVSDISPASAYFVCEWLCGFGRLPDLFDHHQIMADKPWWNASAVMAAVNFAQSLAPFEARMTVVDALRVHSLMRQQDDKTQGVLHLVAASMLNKAQRFSDAVPHAQESYRRNNSNIGLQLLCQSLIGAGQVTQASAMLRQLFEQIEQRAQAISTQAAPSKAFDADDGAVRALFDLTQLLESHVLEPFIISGTLLGWVRSGSLLPHDKDIDVGVLGADATHAVHQALKQSLAFDFDDDMFLREDLYLVQLKHVATGVHADIFFFKERADHFRHGIDSLYGYTQNFRFPKFGLRRVSMLDQEVWVPDDVNAFLAANYGAQWQTPDVDYVVNLESPALEQHSGDVYEFIAYLEAMRSVRKPSRLARIKAALAQSQASEGGVS